MAKFSNIVRLSRVEGTFMRSALVHLLVFGITLAAERGTAAPTAGHITPLALPGLHNAYRYSEKIVGGSSPATPADFAALADLGVKTIISVDGAHPEVQLASREGLRYLHVPFGYDGVPEESKLSLVKALIENDGLIYVHCHHGLHRSVAAIGCMLTGTGEISTADAVAIMRQVGTSTNYAGLYRDVSRMRPMTPGQISGAKRAPETAEVPDFAESMASVDRAWDRLNATQGSGPSERVVTPEIDAAHESLMLAELFAEMQRDKSLSRVGLSAEERVAMKSLLAESAVRFQQLEGMLRTTGSADAISDKLRAAGQSCTTCHERYRN